MARSALLTLLALGALLMPAAFALGREAPVALRPVAVAAKAPQLDTWATVNICDTPASPNALGLRASMRGKNSELRLFMRFTAQYWSSASQAWTTVAGAGVSPWVRAGTDEQAGWTFRFDQPPPGVTFTMRGRVELEWRKPFRGPGGWLVVRQRLRVTETGVLGVEGGDPAGTSKAMCLLY